MKSRFFEKHHGWFSQFSSAFVGTLLGIGITFGVDGFIQFRNDRKTAESMLLTTTFEIDSRYNNLVGQYESMQKFSKVFEQMCYVYDDDPEDFTDELNNKFVSAILPFNAFTVDDGSQQLFYSNIEVLKVFKDLSIISDISSAYALLTLMEGKILEIEGLRKQIYDLFSAGYDWGLVISPEEFEAFMDKPEVRNAMRLYSMKTLVVAPVLGYIKNFNESIKKELGITDEQLETLRSKRTENVQGDTLKTESKHEGENASISDEYSVTVGKSDSK